MKRRHVALRLRVMTAISKLNSSQQKGQELFMIVMWV